MLIFKDCTFSFDIEPGALFDQAYPVAKKNTLLRHGHLPREEDGAIEFWRIKRLSSKQIWALSTLVWWYVEKTRWQEAEATRKDFNIVLIHQDKKFYTSELFKDSQDAILLTLHYRTMWLFRAISSSTYIMSDVHSVYIPSLILDWYREDKILAGTDRRYSLQPWIPCIRITQDPTELDLTKPRLASYKQKWKVHQDTVYWVDIQLAQRKGLKFYQTRSNAVILHDTLPAYCISKNVVMESGEIIYQEVYVSPRPPPTISYKDNWTCDLDSDVARSSEGIRRIELKPSTELSSTGRLVTKWSEESMECTKFDRDTLGQEKHDNVTVSTSTERPVCGHESTERCVLTRKHVENDQTGTGGNPSRWIKKRNTPLISEYQDCHTQL